jgi:hypothetical protein
MDGALSHGKRLIRETYMPSSIFEMPILRCLDLKETRLMWEEQKLVLSRKLEKNKFKKVRYDSVCLLTSNALQQDK